MDCEAVAKGTLYQTIMPCLQTAELSPITGIALPRTPAAAQATVLLSPIAAEQTPLVIFDVSATTRPCSSLSKGLPEKASPGDKLQWLADQVAREVNQLFNIRSVDAAPFPGLFIGREPATQHYLRKQ